MSKKRSAKLSLSHHLILAAVLLLSFWLQPSSLATLGITDQDGDPPLVLSGLVI